MSLEKPSLEKENNFLEQFPHLSHLTEKEQERFLVLHVHNQKQEEKDKKTEKELLKQLSFVHSQEPVPENISLENQRGRSAPLPHERLKRISTNVADFVPVIGSAKMVIEGIRGKQFGTEKEITGTLRLLHGTSGALFFVADLTGIGAIASEFGKAGVKIGTRMLEKEIMKKTATVATKNNIVKEEALKLAIRGEERIDKKEEILAQN